MTEQKKNVPTAKDYVLIKSNSLKISVWNQRCIVSYLARIWIKKGVFYLKSKNWFSLEWQGRHSTQRLCYVGLSWISKNYILDPEMTKVNHAVYKGMHHKNYSPSTIVWRWIQHLIICSFICVIEPEPLLLPSGTSKIFSGTSKIFNVIIIYIDIPDHFWPSPMTSHANLSWLLYWIYQMCLDTRG